MRLILSGLAACAALCAMLGTARAQIFVTNYSGGVFNAGTIGEYTTSGATVNPALVSGLTGPQGIAVSGGNLFVVNKIIGTIGKYTASGAPVNPALISGLGDPIDIAVSGGFLYVADAAGGIGKYTTSGVPVNPALIPLSDGTPTTIAVSGDKLFVVDIHNDVVGEYTTSGATVNPALITGLSFPQDIAVSGDKLFVSDGTTGGRIGEYTTSGATINPALIPGVTGTLAVSEGNLFVVNGFGTVGEYTTSGATVNPVLISGLHDPAFIAVVSASVPDVSSTWALLLLGLTATLGLTPLLRRQV